VDFFVFPLFYKSGISGSLLQAPALQAYRRLWDPTSQLWIHDPMIDVTRVDTVVWSHSKMIYIHVILKDGSDEVTIQA